MDRIPRATATAFAVGALVANVALIAIPFGGTSQLSFIFGDRWPFAIRVSSGLAILASTLVLVVGIGLLRRGASLIASGVFVALGVLRGAGLASHLVQLTQSTGVTGETLLFLLLEATEVGLVFLAASAARREEPAAPS